MGTKISQMSAATMLTGAEQLEVAQQSTTVKISAATISALGSDHSFNDSANGFLTAGFNVGDTVNSSGFGASANNLNSIVVTAVTAGKLTFGNSDGAGITTAAAGPTITITKWKTTRMTIAQLFGTLGPVSVINSTTATPPSTPNDGDTYIIAASPTGAWTGFANYLARWNAGVGAWDIIAPKTGLSTYDVAAASKKLWNGTAWVLFGGASSTPYFGGLFGDTDVPHGYNLTKQGVVLTVGGSGSWKQARVESPNVFWDPKLGQYRMVFTGYSGTSSSPNQAAVGVATSPDLIHWTESGSNPIFGPTNNSGDPDQNGTTGPVVWYEGGTYYLFYIGLTATGLEAGTKSICLATSTDFSTWTRHGAVINTAASTWRSAAVWHPSIVKRNGTYYMFFNAGDGANSGLHESIGFATSTNLTSWTVADSQSPVLDVSGSGWDNTRVGDPFVWRVRDTWYMAYYGNNGTHTQDGMAFTSDESFPLGWTKYSGNPVLANGSSGSFDYGDSGRPCILTTPHRQFHWYSTSDGNTPPLVQIALATDDELNPVTGFTPSPTFTGARAYNDGTQSIPNTTSTAVTFNTNDFDTSSIHSTSSNTSRVTVPAGMGGHWRISYKVTMASGSSGGTIRVAFLRKNGGSDSNNILGSTVAVPPSSQVQTLANTITTVLAAGDYLEIYVYHDSGGSLNIGSAVSSDRGLPCSFEMQFLG